MKNVLIRDTQREDIEEEKSHGIGGRVMWPWAREHPVPPGAKEAKNRSFSLQREYNPTDTLLSDIRPSALEGNK